MKTLKANNDGIEQNVIYSIFKYGVDALNIVNKELEFDDIITPAYKDILGTIRNIHKNTGTIMAIQPFLNYYSGLQEVEEEQKLTVKLALQEIAKNPCKLDDLPVICKEIRRFTAIRKTVSLFNKSVDDLESGVDIEEVIHGVGKGTDGIRTKLNVNRSVDVMGLKGGLDQREKYYTDLANNLINVGVVRTGFDSIDKVISTREEGELVIYQARTNTGKSMFLMGTALTNYIKYGVPTIYITIEMSDRNVCTRMDSHVSKLRHDEFTKATIVKDPNMMNQWKSSVMNAGNIPEDLLVYWVPENCTVKKIDSIIANNPFKPKLVVIDYAGDMKAGIKGLSDYDPKAQAEIYSGLKELAGKHRCVIFTAQQTKRGVKGKVTTEDGSHTDVASSKADLMIGINITKEDKEYSFLNSNRSEEELTDDSVREDVISRMTIEIIKNRNGRKFYIHIFPKFHKMSWIEEEGGAKAVVENKKKKNPLENLKEENTEEIPPLDTNDAVVNKAGENMDAIMD